MKTPTPEVCPPGPGGATRPVTPAAAIEHIRTICASPMTGAGEKYGAILEVLDSLRTPPTGELDGVKPMRFEPLCCPECGELARGTLETVTGVAEFALTPDGAVAYTGHTHVWWAEQRTIEDAGGNVRLVCPQGHDWAARETPQERREPS